MNDQTDVTIYPLHAWLEKQSTTVQERLGAIRICRQNGLWSIAVNVASAKLDGSSDKYTRPVFVEFTSGSLRDLIIRVQYFLAGRPKDVGRLGPLEEALAMTAAAHQDTGTSVGCSGRLTIEVQKALKDARLAKKGKIL